MELSLYGIKKDQGSDKQFSTQLEFIEHRYWSFVIWGYKYSKIKKKPW